MNDGWVIGLGEVLWDIFPDGARFGGAPANFACHASALGAPVAMISAVGPVNDPLANQALEQLDSHGVNTQSVQRNSHETGRVDVALDAQGHPTYAFNLHPAWDEIQWQPELVELAKNCRAVCFGTLAQRAPVSRDTIQRLVREVAKLSSDALLICDINLRVNYWSEECIAESLSLANVLKLNNDELPIVAKACHVLPAGYSVDSQVPLDGAQEAYVLHALLERYSLKVVALTRGAEGATLLTNDAIAHCPAPATVIRDTVGAGDSYTATLMMGLMKGLSLPLINQRAVAVAAYVCSQSGATPQLPAELRMF